VIATPPSNGPAAAAAAATAKKARKPRSIPAETKKSIAANLFGGDNDEDEGAGAGGDTTPDVSDNENGNDDDEESASPSIFGKRKPLSQLDTNKKLRVAGIELSDKQGVLVIVNTSVKANQGGFMNRELELILDRNGRTYVVAVDTLIATQRVFLQIRQVRQFNDFTNEHKPSKNGICIPLGSFAKTLEKKIRQATNTLARGIVPNFDGTGGFEIVKNNNLLEIVPSKDRYKDTCLSFRYTNYEGRRTECTFAAGQLDQLAEALKIVVKDYGHVEEEEYPSY
jgi:hypothetical protein